MTKSDATPIAPVQPKNPKGVEDAIKKGQEVLAGGGSKADAARAIYELLIDEPREIVLRAFVEGATLTEKGAPTYFYNITRKFIKMKSEAKSKKTKKVSDTTPSAN